MKKSLIAIAVVIIVGTSGLAIAQMNDNGKDMMGDKTGMMDGKSGMMGMMGKGMMDGKMMEKNVVATSDGGIVIVAGNKATKYDNVNVTVGNTVAVDIALTIGTGDISLR